MPYWNLPNRRKPVQLYQEAWRSRLGVEGLVWSLLMCYFQKPNPEICTNVFLLLSGQLGNLGTRQQNFPGYVLMTSIICSGEKGRAGSVCSASVSLDLFSS